MIVGEQEGHEAEEELYNLMRGHPTLMVTDGDVESDESDVSDEEPVGEDKDEENNNQSSSSIPEDRVFTFPFRAPEGRSANLVLDPLPHVMIGSSSSEAKPKDDKVEASSSAEQE